MLPYETNVSVGTGNDQNSWITTTYLLGKILINGHLFVTGPEKNARLNNIPVVFARFSKPKRGYYLIENALH